MAALDSLIPTNPLPVVITPAADDDSHYSGPRCTQKQEAFAQAWARTGNKAAAYRMAYDVHERTLPNVVWASASRIANLPSVKARYDEIVQLVTLETIITVRELLQLQVDIATADPTEIVKTVARNCRHCRGNDHKYQWIDETEYLTAMAAALDAERESPDDAGGYGYNGALEPTPTCPHCYGVGHQQTIITPSDKLTGKARRLYKGAKQDRFGCIEILLHDQQRAAELAGRIMGAFDDKVRIDLRTPAQRARDEQAKKLPETLTADQAAKAYLSLLT